MYSLLENMHQQTHAHKGSQEKQKETKYCVVFGGSEMYCSVLSSDTFFTLFVSANEFNMAV